MPPLLVYFRNVSSPPRPRPDEQQPRIWWIHLKISKQLTTYFIIIFSLSTCQAVPRPNPTPTGLYIHRGKWNTYHGPTLGDIYFRLYFISEKTFLNFWQSRNLSSLFIQFKSHLLSPTAQFFRFFPVMVLGIVVPAVEARRRSIDGSSTAILARRECPLDKMSNFRAGKQEITLWFVNSGRPLRKAAKTPIPRPSVVFPDSA